MSRDIIPDLKVIGHVISKEKQSHRIIDSSGETSRWHVNGYPSKPGTVSATAALRDNLSPQNMIREHNNWYPLERSFQ